MDVLKHVLLLALMCLVITRAVKNEPIYPNYTCPDICKCNLDVASANCRALYLTNLTNVPIHRLTIVLDLSSNKLEVIPEEIKFLSELQYLHLQYNHIRAVTANDLRYLENLRVLDMSSNYFAYSVSIEMTLLNPLKKLRTLDISNNRLYNFPDLKKVKSQLKGLNIANCSLSYVSYNILSGFSAIKELNLSHNQIQEIGHLESTTLTSLDLTDCDIQHINLVDLIHLPNLTTVSLLRNKQLKLFITNVSAITNIDMPDCALNEVPTIQSDKLTKMNLDGNRILHIKGNAFQNMSQLITLILSNNIITTIAENAFDDLKMLKFLDLSFNRISELKTYTFDLTTQLVQVYMSYNYINGINLRAPAIRELDASHCEIKSIFRGDLARMPNLLSLNLSHNWLSTLPNNLVANKLKYLDLSMCGIWTLNNETFASMQQLIQLNLQGNRLSSAIGKEVFREINTVYLGDNPWRCDCDNLGFHNLYLWLMEDDRITDSFDLLCRSPVAHEGKHWRDACADYWKVNTGQFWIYTIVAVVVFGILLCFLWHFVQRCNEKRRVREEVAARQAERDEAQARLQRMRLNAWEAREEINRNAPDPRDTECPPNYADAILLAAPKHSTSSVSLSECQISTCASENSKPTVKAKESKRRPLRPRSSVLHNYRSRISTSTVLQDLESRLDTTHTTPSSITSEAEHNYEVMSNNPRTSASETYVESSV